MFDLLGTKIGNFQKIILYLSNILTNTESVSLFPNRERRKFIAARNRQTSCRVVSVFCGYRRGSCRLFYLARYPTTYDSEMGFGTTLFFFVYAAGVRVAEKPRLWKSYCWRFVPRCLLCTIVWGNEMWLHVIRGHRFLDAPLQGLPTIPYISKSTVVICDTGSRFGEM